MLINGIHDQLRSDHPCNENDSTTRCGRVRKRKNMSKSDVANIDLG